MFAVVLGCVLCSLSTAAYLSERECARTGTLLSRRLYGKTEAEGRAQEGETGQPW